MAGDGNGIYSGFVKDSWPKLYFSFILAHKDSKKQNKNKAKAISAELLEETRRKSKKQ